MSSSTLQNSPITYQSKWGPLQVLNGLNYEAWFRALRLVLLSISGLDIVLGNELPPPPATNATQRTAVTDFRERSGQAAALIYNSCKEEIQVYLDEMTCPREMWAFLKQKYHAASDPVRRQAVARQFRSMKQNENEKIDSYYSRLFHTRRLLRGSPDEISDSEFISHIYHNIKSDYSLTVAILQERTPQPTAEDILASLRNDEQRRAVTTNILTEDLAATSGSALITQTNPSAFRRTSYRQSDRFKPYAKRECFKCKMPGHIAKDCRSPAPTQRPAQVLPSNTVVQCTYCARFSHEESGCWFKKEAEQLKKQQKQLPNQQSAHVAYAWDNQNL
jgi:hypothetical protein